jgi:hypothetical protein
MPTTLPAENINQIIAKKVEFAQKAGFRYRCFPESNYQSFFVDGSTIRSPLDVSKPITELKFAEFYDVSFGTKCVGGCVDCYASASNKGVHYTNIVDKIYKFFGNMTLNQRPYQVACGGEGDSTEHPDCWEAMKAFNSLGITPNITTHGLNINDKTIGLFKQHLGGMAISLHPHLRKTWDRSIKMVQEAGIHLALHFVFSDKESFEMLEEVYAKYSHAAKWFVLLPRMNVGFAANNKKNVDTLELKKFMDAHWKDGKIAIGANAAGFLFENGNNYNISMYPPEIMSKYLFLNDELSTYNNSFHRVPVKFDPIEGFELGKVRSDYSLI